MRIFQNKTELNLNFYLQILYKVKVSPVKAWPHSRAKTGPSLTSPSEMWWEAKVAELKEAKTTPSKKLRPQQLTTPASTNTTKPITNPVNLQYIQVFIS